jgi:1-deoxyxylulose-5-phosphate synthase
MKLGYAGLEVSRLCLGCMSYGTPEWRDWVLPEEESRPFLRRALELGVNFFDTAAEDLAALAEPYRPHPVLGFRQRQASPP